MLLLREGGCWPKSRYTWPHPSSPQYSAVILSPLQKCTPKAWFSTPMLHAWDGVLGIVLIPLLPPNTASGVYTKKLYFGLIWPHNLLPCLLWNFRRAWTCAGLSRGNLRALQDFNPWRCSVLLMVTVETVVLALFRSLTRSSHVVLGWSLTFLRIIDTPRGENLHGAPVRGRLTVILNFFHFLIIAPTLRLLTKLFAYCPVAHPSLVQVYNFVPSVLRQLFGLAHSGEVGVWLIECVNRWLLYR